MFSLRHLKVMVLIVGFSVVSFGIIAAFQVQEADATGGRIRYFTRTYTWSKPLWGKTEMETGPCPHVYTPLAPCHVTNRPKEVRYRFYDVYRITETYVDTGDDVYMMESSKEFLRREKRKQWEHLDICPNSQCPSNVLVYN